MGQVKLGRVISRKTRQASTFQRRRADLFMEASSLSNLCHVPVAVMVHAPGEATEPAIWPPAESASILLQRYKIFLLRQRTEKLSRLLRVVKLANRAHEVSLVLADLLAGHHQVLDGVPVDLAVDVRAVLRLRLKVVSGAIGSRSATVDVADDGEIRRGSGLLEKTAAVMAEESGGAQPTDAELERFLGELLLLKWPV